MVDPEKQRARYVSGAEGAPPVPPPGGYHGVRRRSLPDAPATVAVSEFDALLGVASNDDERDVVEKRKKPPSSPIGWIALVAAILFSVVLLGLLLAGSTDLLYGVTVLVLQLVVLGAAIAALCTARGRMLGASALVITLLLNVATVGAASALQTSASGNYQGQKTEDQKHAEAYPGIKGTTSADILTRMPLESVRAQSDAAMAEIRDRLSDRFGYSWVQVDDEVLRPERNGYGGESMLVEYSSAVWATVEPIHDYDEKIAAMGIVEEVLYDYGMYSMYSFNDPSSSMDDTVREKFYGSNDPRTQTTWEWYTDNYPDPIRAYAVINDVSNDRTGEFAAEREAESARTGEPLEGLQLFTLAPEVLSDDDRAEFAKRMKDYPGY